MGKPEIRFKGYTDEWEQRKLGELVKEGILEAPLDGNHGEKHPTSDEYVESGIPFLMASDIHNGEVNIYSCKYITKERAERLDKGFARNGDVLLTHKATIGETAILSNLMTEYAMLAPQVTYYRIKNEERLNREYLYSFFNSLDFQTELKTKAAQSTRPYIGITAQQNLKIILPTEIDEQRKIGLYFGNLDRLITLHQRKCDEVKSLKKYMLQKMFPQNEQKVPEIRFEGFTEAWEQRKLIEVCDYVDYRGKTPTKTENGIFLVTAKNVKDGFIDYETSKEYISENAYEEVMRRGKPEIGDVLITTEAPCGNVAQVNKADIALAQRIIKYRGHIGVVDNTYLKHYLLSPEFQKILNAKSSGGTVQGIKGSILHQQKIIYPSYEEQKKIGQHMDSLDNLITLHQHKCEELKKLKKFMLQNMFI